MKNFKYILVCTAALTMISSCKKSFLDVEPTDNISTQQEAAANKYDSSIENDRVLGLYVAMYTDFIGGSGGDHDDFGQKGIDIFSDMLVSDMALASVNYGWYAPIVKYQATKNNTAVEDYIPFRYYYKIILGANTIIDFLGGNNAVLTNTDFKHYMGQAKAMRAYAYFYLANLYSTGYGTGTEKMLPIYTSAKQVNMPLNTSAQVYSQMENDLIAAINLLKDFKRSNKGQIDVDVARGLLAYVYAARGTTADLGKVVLETDTILNSNKYPLTTQNEVVANFDVDGDVTNTAEAGFNNLATPSWMWGADLTLSSGLDLVSWWGQIDIFTYSYAWAGDPKFIDSGLYSTYTTGTATTNPHYNDIRKGQFDDNPDYGGLLPTGKFFDAARVEGGQRSVTDDYIYMRSDEMVLLNAEANCKLGNASDAKASLGQLMALRYSDPTDYTAYSIYLSGLSGSTLGSPLFEEIYLQSRLELWGEGKTYLSMKRNKHSIIRGDNHLFLAGSKYDYNAPELTFPLPSAEILYNPNLNK